MAVLTNPDNPAADATLKELGGAARTMGLQIRVLRASTGREIDAAFATFVRERPDALFVTGEPYFNTRRVQLIVLAAFHRVPTTFGLRDYAEAGGLMGYGANLGCLSSGRRLYRPDLERPEGGRPAGRATKQIRAGDQQPDSSDARHHRAAVVARPRG